MNVNNPYNLSHVSLCYGYGGIDLGLERVFGSNIRTTLAVEIEAYAIENIISKMEEGRISPCPIWSDLRTVPWQLLAGKMDILSGGFPCQPFSAAGKRAGDEDPRHLFPYILQGITIGRPRYVFLENVEGILSAKLAGEGWRDPAGTPVLLHIIRELERVGYTAEAGMFSAEEVGAPHRRNRIFIIGVDNSQPAGLEGLIWSNGYASGWQDEDRSAVEAGVCGWRRITISEEHAECGGDEEVSHSERQIFEYGESVDGALYRRPRTIWPARPGQPQFDWEPPRTV